VNKLLSSLFAKDRASFAMLCCPLEMIAKPGLVRASDDKVRPTLLLNAAKEGKN
jgi:hypothetical protein